jgi:hypothetical protein
MEVVVYVWLVGKNVWILSPTMGQWGYPEGVKKYGVDEVRLEGMLEYFEGYSWDEYDIR